MCGMKGQTRRQYIFLMRVYIVVLPVARVPWRGRTLKFTRPHEAVEASFRIVLTTSFGSYCCIASIAHENLAASVNLAKNSSACLRKSTL